MCGIVGILGNNWNGASLVNATKAMSHRGPDDSGIEILPTKSGRLGFGHRRLSILDISAAGHQPMIDPITQNMIIYNGEIYNHRELRNILPEREFQSSCDTETLLAAYAQWGESVVEHLIGMYAFAIWNPHKQELFLARDRIGIKPLYYTNNQGTFNFASEIKALLAGNMTSKRLDPESIESYLAFGAVQAPKTILKDTFLLPPGHWMRVNAEGRIIETQQYWSLSHFFSEFDRTDKPNNHIKEEIYSSIKQAVSDRLISDVPLGAFLSGGIDSSVVVGMMAASSENKPKTFCLDFDEGPYQEGKYAELIASKFQTDHKTTMVHPNDLISRLDKAFYFMDQPTCDGINSYFVSEIARQNGVTVALSGQGGDELFAGYPSFYNLPKAIKLSAIPIWLRHIIGLSLSPLKNLSAGWNCLIDFVNSEDMSMFNAYAHIRSIFGDYLRKDILQTNKITKDIDFIRMAIGHDKLPNHPVDQVSQLEIYCYLMNTLLRDLDTFSMAHSLEVRVPLLDHRLLELIAQISGAYKIDRHINKHLLVKTMEKSLPYEVVHRPKGLFWFPWNQWLRTDLSGKIKPVFNSSKSDFESVGLQADKVHNLWNRFQKGDRLVRWLHIWTIYVLLRWCEEKDVSL